MASVNEARMPLLDHLRELRKRVLRSAIAVLVAFSGGWYFYDSIIVTLAAPVCDLRAAQQSGAASCGALYISGVLGPLDLQIKVALLTGIIVSAPFWLYQLWAFIAPALHRKEKRTSVMFVSAATPFFAMGATLGYFILPVAIKALFGFTPDSISNLVRFDDYLDFVLRLILFVGLAFELPIFLLTFNLIGFLRGKNNFETMANLDLYDFLLCRGPVANRRSLKHGPSIWPFDPLLLYGGLYRGTGRSPSR
jgi:sec-independent protein translocase protein TatC